MKTLVLIGFLLCVAFAIAAAEEGVKCNSPADCAEDECCSSVLRDIRAQCRKLRQKGEPCTEDLKEPINGYYIGRCPCAAGLTCKYREDGTADISKVKCG